MTRRGGWPPTGFGECLRQAREGAGLTQQQVADKAGCNVFTVAKTERGEQEPAWPLVLALARALGVQVGSFVPPGLEGAAAPAPQPAPRPRGRPKKRQAQRHPGGGGPQPELPPRGTGQTAAPAEGGKSRGKQGRRKGKGN